VFKGLDPSPGSEFSCTMRTTSDGAEINANCPARVHARWYAGAGGHFHIALLGVILTVLPLDRMVEAAAFRPVAADQAARPIHSEFDATIETYEPSLPIAAFKDASSYDHVKSVYLILATGKPYLCENVVLRKDLIDEDIERPAGQAEECGHKRAVDKGTP